MADAVKTLDEALGEIWAWKERVAEHVSSMTPEKRRTFWGRAEEDAGRLLGRPFKLPRRPVAPAPVPSTHAA